MSKVFNIVVKGGEPEYITIPDITDGKVSQDFYNVITLSLTQQQAIEMRTNANIKFTANGFTFALQKLDYNYEEGTFVFHGVVELDNIAIFPAMAAMFEDSMKIVTFG